MKKNRSDFKRRYSGFTLIELLVVITIIAILAAILFPVFASAREKARQSTCASNLKQISVGYLQYMQDFDEITPYTIPGSVCVTPGCSGGPYLAVAPLGLLLDPYIKSYDIWCCPSDNAIAPDAPRTSTPKFSKVSYAYNFYFLQKWNPGASASNGKYPALALSQMQTPASDGILFGTFFNSTNSWGFNTPDAYEYIEGNTIFHVGTPVSAANQLIITRGHSGGGNCIFADGHLKWLPGSYIAQQKGLELTIGTSVRTFGSKPTLFHE